MCVVMNRYFSSTEYLSKLYEELIIPKAAVDDITFKVAEMF